MMQIGYAYAGADQRKRAIEVFDGLIASYGGDPEAKPVVSVAKHKRAELIASR